MEMKPEFVKVLMMAFDRQLASDERKVFAIPGNLMPPESINTDERNALTAAGFKWEEENDLWIANAENLIDA